VDLSGVALGRADAAGQVAAGAIRTVELLACPFCGPCQSWPRFVETYEAL